MKAFARSPTVVKGVDLVDFPWPQKASRMNPQRCRAKST